MKLHQAKRQNVKIKLGIQGVAGSGKTKSALLLSYGLVGDWTKIAVVDTENSSSELYSTMGPFNVLSLSAPYTPERFIEAVETCVTAGMEAVVLDSISAEWQNILQEHSSLSGNSYTNWSKLTPRHQQFVNAIVQADVHIICTLRSKQAYVMVEKNGKHIPEKIGLKPVQRDDVDYELSLVFQLALNHLATAIKDRTEVFADIPAFLITIETGRKLKKWCEEENFEEQLLKAKIEQCTDVPSLKSIFESHPLYQESLRHSFNIRKQQLLSSNGNSYNHSVTA
ncbi:AAA family ATPase [Dyadobacter chenhuakuii]|uniref:ATP-binding protein n=1 Tax=Dyadobacter chenhuakuii TaxID=2909339 RepID=A0A9X1QK41_9BACT|nr:AAA family ATPase [Dyadobacter chenhuakuii]MCF2501693.1 ATP-binding protein [Dyadobacter chenhuakuii]